jgi:hypothetical protein
MRLVANSFSSTRKKEGDRDASEEGEETGEEGQEGRQEGRQEEEVNIRAYYAASIVGPVAAASKEAAAFFARGQLATNGRCRRAFSCTSMPYTLRTFSIPYDLRPMTYDLSSL